MRTLRPDNLALAPCSTLRRSTPLFPFPLSAFPLSAFPLSAFPLSAFLLLLFAIAAVAGGVKPGDTFPELAGFKLEGKVPDSIKGKVVLVDFWASWCEPCKQSFPVMQELQTRYADKGLVIIAVNVDENRPDMEAFLKKNTATFVVLRDPNQKLVEKTGIATMPSSFLLDRDGKVRFTHTGFRGAETKKKYEEEIESLLK